MKYAFIMFFLLPCTIVWGMKNLHEIEQVAKNIRKTRDKISDKRDLSKQFFGYAEACKNIKQEVKSEIVMTQYGRNTICFHFSGPYIYFPQ